MTFMKQMKKRRSIAEAETLIYQVGNEDIGTTFCKSCGMSV